MRLFKFRGWNKTDKVMVYDINSLRLRHGILESDDYELMQYAELKDNNGKELYEGDILSYILPLTPDDLSTSAILGAVQFEDSMWRVGQECLCDYRSEAIEIIGNIYENPELNEDQS